MDFSQKAVAILYRDWHSCLLSLGRSLCSSATSRDVVSGGLVHLFSEFIIVGENRVQVFSLFLQFIGETLPW